MATAVFASALEAGEASAPVRIGTHEQLFLDDHVIARTEGVTRRVNQGRKRPEPVIVPDRPWERNSALLFGSVIHDREEGVFKVWYHASGHVGYAVSDDGLVWRKPELAVVEWQGRKTNLVVERGKLGHFYELFGVLKDPEDPDPARRYKMAFVSIEHGFADTYRWQFHREQRRGLGTAVSPDGIHWTLEDDCASTDICDISRLYRDPADGKYVLLGRTKLTAKRNDGSWKLSGWGRAVHYLESSDFRQWTDGELVFAADHGDPDGTEIYSISSFPYEGVAIGMAQMFYGLPDQGNLDIQLTVSRDRKHYARVEPRLPFIPEGPIGSWDRYNISLGCLPPVTVGDELWFYYGARTHRHSPYKGDDSGPSAGRIGLATVKRGRFLALEASFAGGTLRTKPFIVEGGELLLNVNAAYGTVEVVLEDAGGNAAVQATVSHQDGVSVPVPLPSGALAGLAGKPARLVFTLRNAQLYGFRVR